MWLTQTGDLPILPILSVKKSGNLNRNLDIWVLNYIEERWKFCTGVDFVTYQGRKSDLAKILGILYFNNIVS